MRTKVIDTILPTTMIGSYPKPRWFEEYNLEGADLLEWWKLEKHFQAYRDAGEARPKRSDIIFLSELHADRCFASSSPDWRRPAIKTYAPSSTKVFAAAKPIPLLLPVTTATLPLNFAMT
jgi:hypothetical protein